MFTWLAVLFIVSTVSNINCISKCDDIFLNIKCTTIFKAGIESECNGEALQLFPRCLYMASECKAARPASKTTYLHSANITFSETYKDLLKKVRLYKSCFSRESTRCNESRIKDCYENFNRNSSDVCDEVHKLRLCILLLQTRGCHEMRNPWYTLAFDIIKRHHTCFIQNYSVVLEVLQQRNPSIKTYPSQPKQGQIKPTPIVCPSKPDIAKKETGMKYQVFIMIIVCVLVIFMLILLFICMKRSGMPRKRRRRFLSNTARQGNMASGLIDVRQLQTSNDQHRPLTLVVDDHEAPPPYFVEGINPFLNYGDCPPPYTSRPTSVNGDFV